MSASTSCWVSQDCCRTGCRSSSGHKSDPRKGLSPIIIVPKGYETKINMYNAKVHFYPVWPQRTS